MGPDGSLYGTETYRPSDYSVYGAYGNNVYRYTAGSGVITSLAWFSKVEALTVAPDSSVYVAIGTGDNNTSAQVVRIYPDGRRVVIPLRTSDTLFVDSMAVDISGTVYVADDSNGDNTDGADYNTRDSGAIESISGDGPATTVITGIQGPPVNLSIGENNSLYVQEGNDGQAGAEDRIDISTGTRTTIPEMRAWWPSGPTYATSDGYHFWSRWPAGGDIFSYPGSLIMESPSGEQTTLTGGLCVSFPEGFPGFLPPPPTVLGNLPNACTSSIRSITSDRSNYR